jgi:hypothetical protein
MLNGRPTNFIEVMEQLRHGRAAHVVNGDFLDAFYAAPAQMRQEFLNNEPPDFDDVAITPSSRAQFAAVAEKLAHDFELEVPAWTEKSEYFLKDVVIAGRPVSDAPAALVKLLEAETPVEFGRRNILVTSNLLTRV